MIPLPKGVTVWAGGRPYKGKIPEALCPKHLKPETKPAAGKKK